MHYEEKNNYKFPRQKSIKNVECVYARINISMFLQQYESPQDRKNDRCLLVNVLTSYSGSHERNCFCIPLQVIEAGVHQREAELRWSFWISCLFRRRAGRCLAVHYSVLVCVTFEGLPTSVLLPVTPFPHNAPAARPR